VIRNIKLIISYDGTEFSGWQVQREDRSVQGVLEDALADLHNRRVPIVGAGRTDSGVHAVGQVGNFRTDKDAIPDWKFRDALNARLPGDLRILRSERVPDDFHSRRDAVNRRYEYRFLEGSACPAHLVRYVWLVKRFPPIDALNDMASVLCGTHDFTTFAAAGDASESRIRRIEHAVVHTEGPGAVFKISGNAFLWRMVRSIVGTLVDLGLRGGDADAMRGILLSRDRDAAGPTAPAKGLFLTKVNYGP
jgi:tRNA pseudouridine38-40 synthase